MLFFAKWPERVSLLVDAPQLVESEARAYALAVAAKVAAEDGGPAPSSLLGPVLGFVAEVLDQESEGDGGAGFLLEPLPHVSDLLAGLEDSTDDPPVLTVAPLATSIECRDEADDAAGELHICTKEPGHAGKHRSAGGMVWT